MAHSGSTTARREPTAGGAIALAFLRQLATLPSTMSRGLSGFGWCVATTLVLSQSAGALEAGGASAGQVTPQQPSPSASWLHQGAYRCSTGLTVEWDFRTASPMAAPPALSAEGQLYVATHEGYLHAVSRDGDFLWSYTVDGALLWGAGVDTRGRIQTISSAGTIYLFTPSGNPRWVYGFRSPSSSVMFAKGGMMLVPHGYNLYALAPGAGVRWRAFLGSEVNSGPWVREDGSAWLTTRDGQLRRVTNARSPSAVVEVGSNARVMGVNADGAALVLRDGVLSAIDESGESVWHREAVRAVSPDGRLLVGEQELLWLDAQGGLEAEVAFSGTLSAAPVLAGDWAWVPTVQGDMVAVNRNGTVESCRISAAPLMLPIVDAAHQRVVATAGDGTLSAVRHREAR